MNSSIRQRTASVDWNQVLRQLMEGDRLALARLSRLINGFLSRWNAYDFRDDWDDLIQEVVVAAVLAVRAGQLRDPAAVIGWLRTTARFKFVDRLRSQLRCPESESLAAEDEPESIDVPSEASDQLALRGDMKRALGRLPAKTQAAVLGVYVHGKTYDEVAAESGIPLGSLKRYLRDGLAQLRGELRAFAPSE